MKIGVQGRDEMGRVEWEVGPHVLTSFPGFTEGMGQVAAAWAQAEVLLGCYYALLIETTPEGALALLGRKGAAAVTAEARNEAENRLTGIELQAVGLALEKMDAVREPRNRLQHDVWVRLNGDDNVVYAMEAKYYVSLIAGTAELPLNKDPNVAEKSIELGATFIKKASNAFSLESVQALRDNIIELTGVLMRLYLARLRMRLT